MRRVRRIGPTFMGSCCQALEEGAVQVPFPSLQVLEFEDMEEWEEWEAPRGTDDGGEDDQLLGVPPPPPPPRRHHHHPLFLPLLRELTIRNCPKLRQLPPLPPMLAELRIENVGLNDLPGWSGCSSSSSSSSSSPYSLNSLEIKHCPDLTSLAGGLLRHPLLKLVLLIIEDCQGLVSLPETAFGHHTSLKQLEVRGCPKLSWPSFESVEDTLPPSLERITIGENAGEATDHMMLAIIGSQKLTCLRYLWIGGCCFSWPPPTLEGEFGRLPSSLQELTIYKNDQLDDETLSAWLQGLTSLRHLWIKECPAVTSLSHLTTLVYLDIRCLKALKSFGGGVHSLETLVIGDCPELVDIITATDSSPSPSPLPSPAGVGTMLPIRTLYIWGSRMQQIKTWLLQCPSLQRLSISDCPQLTGFGGNGGSGGDVGGELEAALLNLSGTLQHLFFWECENLRSLPPRLRCLSSLESLKIMSCPQIRSLPAAGLPESLQSLEIIRCPALEERCKEGEGSDWPLITHIPDLRI